MKSLTLLFILVLFGCKPKPEFYINGKAYYTRTRCINSDSKDVYEFHYGYNVWSGKFEWHYGSHTVTTCLDYKIDTIEIK